MSYLYPSSYEDNIWPQHPQRFTSIGQYREACFITRSIPTVIQTPDGFAIKQETDPDNLCDNNGDLIRFYKVSASGADYTPRFETVKEAIRWLWFSRAKNLNANMVCADCDRDDARWVLTPTPYDAYAAKPLCDSCVENDYSIGDHTIRWNLLQVTMVGQREVISARHIWTHVAYWHESDCIQCDDCHDHFPASELHDTYAGESVCMDCRDNQYIYCVDVDAYVYCDDANYCDANGDYYYDDCNFPRVSRIHGYSANVLNHHGNQCYVRNAAKHLRHHEETLLFGVELETDRRSGYDQNDLAEAVLDLDFDKYGICKEDSTVSGIEMVTLPCDLQSHRELLPWKQWCDALRPIAKGHHGRDNGIHIHINRGAMHKLTLGKVLVFMNNHLHQDFLEMIAQRPMNSWCPQSTQDKFKRVGRAGNDPYAGKYAIMNTTPNTVECRMFNSSLLHERIFKNIEFLHALVKWAANQSANVIERNNDSSRSFIDYVEKNRTEYVHLNQFINNRYEA